MAEEAKKEEAKRIRTSAKSRFTRKRNEFLKSVEGNKGIEAVKRTFADLHEAWNIVEGKHDIYMIHLTEDEIEQNEAWINELQELYEEAATTHARYVNDQTLHEQKRVEEFHKQESMRLEQEKLRRLLEQFSMKKKSMGIIFDTLVKHAHDTMESRNKDVNAPEALRKTERDLDIALADCKALHNTMLELLDHENVEKEIEWIRNMHARHQEISGRIEAFISAKRNNSNVKEKGNPLQLEKIKMPSFHGNVRNYPQFKADFEKQVMPSINAENAPYVLRSCLGKEPADTVKSVDDDINAMWKRLDEKYGDPAKVADVIMCAIQNMKPIREGENKRFVEFINVIDDGYRDLRRLSLEKEITTTSSVSIIERKLPNDVKREWAKLVSSEHSLVNKRDKFPSLLRFLLEQKQAIEYENAELRSSNNLQVRGSLHYLDKKDDKLTIPEGQGMSRYKRSKCLYHEGANHWTNECRLYLSKPVQERRDTLKERGACWSCLKRGHRTQDCRGKKPCGINDCKRFHHKTLHEEEQDKESPTDIASASGTASVCNNNEIETCLLQIQKIPTKNGFANVLWDTGASLCFITNAKARAENLKGIKTQLSIIKVGGESENVDTFKYKLPLIDKQGKTVVFNVYGIDKITSPIPAVNIKGISKLFKDVYEDELIRPTGEVDTLIGYEYADFHPLKEQSSGHLLLLRNRFGRCVGGTHPVLEGINEKPLIGTIHAHHVKMARIEDFYNMENLGIQCRPRCGGCMCGKCSLGSNAYTIKEEKELALIEKNLSHDAKQKFWTAEYPWIRDPFDLPDNRRAAFGMLISTEKRLSKNEKHAEIYQQQIQDMIDRDVARKLTQEELRKYTGPAHYISHHEVLKPDSKSTPVRIVFNSSANYMGHVLNEYWAKGPDLLNSLLGILIRFRENETAFIGDIKKMYHTVRTGVIEQHTHRFLWRDMDVTREPDTYVIQRVSFGDKPSGTIATVALRKTAEMAKEKYPKASDLLINNTYMDDIINSVDNVETAKKLTNEMETILSNGNFKIKEWIYSHDNIAPDQDLIPTDKKTAHEKVLGVVWNPITDTFCFKVKLNFTPKSKKRRPKQNQGTTTNTSKTLTKRIILSQVNSVYDPLGLASPLTVRAKILLRRLWIHNPKLDWDDPIPEEDHQNWDNFFQDLSEMEKIKVNRCIKPTEATGNPTLVIFSDGSNDAYGACAYVRWKLLNGDHEANLILSKNRLAPSKKLSIDRIELCGAVLNKRLKTTITEQCRYHFEKCYHITDSQIVHSMIQKESYGFNTFAAVRVGEVQEGTNTKDWYWTASEFNVADLLTRGSKPNDIDVNSKWQRGPEFLKLHESEWPITKTYSEQKIPINTIKLESSLPANQTSPEDTLASRINIEKYSNYKKLLRVTARILAMYKKELKPTMKNATRTLTTDDIDNAERFWILESQASMQKDIQSGKYKRLCPRKRDDGIYVVGGRARGWVEMSYNKSEIILLPYGHRFSRLYAEHIHSRGHLGVLSTASKIRANFWITKLLKLVKSIRTNCVICKKLDKKLNEQIMGKLPTERLKPAPAWTYTALDLFGPFKIKDEVKKRTTGKAYGIIFNCLGTRAVHIDISPDYSTEKFLIALRRFVSIRGYPSKIYSDNGSQLVAASEELKKMVKTLDQKSLQDYGCVEGFQWVFSSADAPWQNGVSEALIKSTKRAITAAIGESILTFSELQTVCYEAANLLNERPIGRHPTSPDDKYLCPNDLLLGRSTSKIPNGPFTDSADPRRRFEFVQMITDNFWKKWTRDYFPSLLIQQKWHTAHRNLKVGDVVLIQDSNLIRSQWKLGKVSKTFEGQDGKVRKVQVQYKNPKPGEPVLKYSGRGYVTIERPVNKLVVLLPNEEDKLSE